MSMYFQERKKNPILGFSFQETCVRGGAREAEAGGPVLVGGDRAGFPRPQEEVDRPLGRIRRGRYWSCGPSTAPLCAVWRVPIVLPPPTESPQQRRGSRTLTIHPVVAHSSYHWMRSSQMENFFKSVEDTVEVNILIYVLMKYHNLHRVLCVTLSHYWSLY